MTRTFSPRIRLGMGAAALLAPFAGACATTQTAAPSRGEAPALKDVFARRFLMGAAINADVLSAESERTLVARHYNSITSRSAMKAYAIAPQAEGQYDFADAEAHVRFAQASGAQMRGHTLVWHWKSDTRNAAPDWFFAGDRSDPGYRALVRRRLEKYITDVVSHFRGRVYAWDVVNEGASDNSGEIHRTDTPWHQTLGPEYIDIAFRAARAADPDAALFFNDYNTEQPGKLARVMAIVDDLRGRGVPIDGVGHQFHLRYNTQLDGVAAALRATGERGLISHVTELDVSLYDDPDSCFSDKTTCLPDLGAATPTALLTQQARLYRALFEEFARHPNLKSVTTWGHSDAFTWLNGFPAARTNRPLLFDTEGKPKQAFWAVVDPGYFICDA
jgi:endo-1,4-beta-xylanase